MTLDPQLEKFVDDVRMRYTREETSGVELERYALALAAEAGDFAECVLAGENADDTIYVLERIGVILLAIRNRLGDCDNEA